MEVDVDNSVGGNKLSSKELLRRNMLDHLCKSTEAHFKSQQRGEPELLDCEKRVIAESILNRNLGTFLSRFGSYLLEDHLEYFTECPESERYEVDFYLKQIRAAHNESVSRVKVRNRRFEALKQLVSEGSYFSEYEMKKRNPLLYEQLIGKFLTEEEEKERTGVDTTNITFVNLILEQYDREQMKKLKKQQKEDEEKANGQMVGDAEKMRVDLKSNENDISRERNNGKSTLLDDDFDDNPVIKTLWGEEMTEKSHMCEFPSSSKNDISPNKTNTTGSYEDEGDDDDEEEEEDLSDDERNLLMEEFRSSMFNSFLEGKDADFDYNEVDKNSEYDDIDMRDVDEQDQYFNSETPEDVRSSENSNQGGSRNSISMPVVKDTTDDMALSVDKTVAENDHSSEEKLIDSYVESLKDIENTEKLTTEMKNLHH